VYEPERGTHGYRRRALSSGDRAVRGAGPGGRPARAPPPMGKTVTLYGGKGIVPKCPDGGLTVRWFRAAHGGIQARRASEGFLPRLQRLAPTLAGASGWYGTAP
jgi:hypothetical protein